MPRRKPVPNPTSDNTDAEDNAGRHSDSHTRRPSIEDEDISSTQLVLVQNDNEDRPESLQRTPTGSVSSHNSEIVNNGADTSSPETLPTNQHQEWLPFYLRRGVFIAFAVILGIMVVALEVLFAVSQKHQGLTDSYTSLHYLWTYGPTALLTLVQALWNRVDYEAKVTAPWLRANPIYNSRDALLLDYIDMFPLAVPFRAFKRRDYPVAAGATISLLFTMLIVLSTGLFTLSSVELVDTQVPISMKTQFSGDLARLNNTSLLSIGAFKAASVGLPYADGISEKFAYQSFSSDLPGISETNATVDGIYTGLDCAQTTVSDIRFNGEGFSNEPSAEGYVTMRLENGDCDLTASFYQGRGIPRNLTKGLDPDFYLFISPLKGLAPGHCQSTSLEYDRLVVFAASLQFNLVNRTETPTSNASVNLIHYEFEAIDVQSAAVVCAPDYGIIPVDVVRNSTGVKSVTRHGDVAPRQFPDIHSWNILLAYLYGDPEYNGNDLYFNYTDGYFTCNYRATNFIYTFPDYILAKVSLLLNGTFLENLVVDFNQRSAAIFLGQSFTERVDISSTATASRIADRLIVQPASSQWMVGTMVIMMIILIALSLTQLRNLPSRMEPGSILATAALAGRPTESWFPRDLGSVDTKTLETKITKLDNNIPAGSSSHTANETENRQETDNPPSSTKTLKLDSPIVLRPVFRVIMFILIASCVAVLEVLLQKSDRDQGLGDVQDDTYLHYLWTVLPATLVSSLSLYLSSVDTQTRLLAPYHSLISVVSIGPSLEADLLRPLMPVALFRQIRARSLNTLAISLAALVASIFTIGIASLYQLRTLPASTPMDVRTTSTFATYCDGDGYIKSDRSCYTLYENTWSNASSPLDPGAWSALLLEGNLSYTPLVYENLVFPQITLDHLGVNDSQISEDTVISLTLPALRPQLSCHWHAESDIAADFFYNQSVTPPTGLTSIMSDGLAVNITGEDCALDGYFVSPATTAAFATSLPAEALFATATNPTASVFGFGCSKFLFIWGRFSSFAENSEIFTKALACNGTTETVDVVASFIGPQLQLDPSRPPKPIESTSRAYALYIPDARETYSQISPLPLRRNDTLFDGFFQTLVTSRYAIPVASIGDPSQTEAVKDAIAFQHGVAVAQLISRYYRVKAEPSRWTNGSIFPSLSNLTPTTDTGMYPATASDPYGRRRLVQDPTSTRVVQALLLAALLLSLVGWGLGPGKAVLPRSPTSVASVLALLAGGDVLEYMYKEGGANWETVKDAKAVFPDDCKFWMGWGPPGASRLEKERRFGIWMVPF
ncbi:hypothetical protein F4821DRAFT_276960 [Hypoxylon rubiginosum]|uniref:Uncharacterized protein n=1 Tax=Hypoxylon rubiginosum TaxID=110542 RepID=A0ACC0D7X3_9PEZI|nr:hypothetical protein F4821DRAFT_276960 [Hypoxylon rubiginosum]